MYIFVGMSEESKGFRLYDPLTHKIIISKDVVIEEDKAWNLNKSHEGQIQTNLDCNETEDDKEKENMVQDERGAEEGDAVEEAAKFSR